MDPSSGAVAGQPIEARIEGGLRLVGLLWPSDAPRALVAIVHGIGEHSGRYAAFASDLAAMGCTVVALDLPGHGRSMGSRGDMRSWVAVRDQAIAAMFAAPRGLPGHPDPLPHVLFGHSMGGLMALDFTLANPRGLDATVVTAPGIRSAIPPWWKLVLANVARSAAPSVGFPTGLPTRGEGGISRDAEVMRLRDEDSMMHDKISPRLYFDLAEARMRVMRDARRLQVPTLLMLGEADRMVFPEGTQEFAAAAPKGMAKLITYPGAYHEILNDLDREHVLRDMRAWLDQVLGRRGETRTAR